MMKPTEDSSINNCNERNKFSVIQLHDSMKSGFKHLQTGESADATTNETMES